MKHTFCSRARKQTFFARSMLAFLAVILTLTLFYVVVQFVYISSMKRERLDITQKQFDSSIATMERFFDQMKYTYAEISTDPTMFHIVENQCGPNYNYAKVINKIRSTSYSRKQNEFIPFLDALCLVTPGKNNTIVDSEGTYGRENFFTFHFNNSFYNDKFWLDQMQKDIVFKAYPIGLFNSVNNSTLSEHMVMPIAYKLPSNNNYIIVSLFNIDAAINEATKDLKGSMTITDRSGQALYPKKSLINLQELHIKNGQRVKRVNGNYIYTTQSAMSGLTYYYAIPTSVVFKTERHISIITTILWLVALAATIIFAVLLSKRFNRKITRISTHIQDSGCFDDKIPDVDINEIAFIDHGISSLIQKNQQYVSEITEKDSLLKAIFLQTRMRDIYVSIEDVEKQINISQAYVMIYMRVHYKDEFYQKVQEEQGKSTFFLKQLIELYLSSSKAEFTTFQIENDQIVSIVDTASDGSDVLEIINTITKKLENESEYVFFTIVVSKVHDNVGELKMNFDHLSELSKYAMPVMETQVLVEGEVKQGAGRFYFTVEQMEKLSALMQNESLEECIRTLNEILDYNVKKEVNGFDLYLLCTEIVSCGVKLVNRLFHSTPQSLRISQVYAQLDKAVTLEQYQKICAGLIREVVEYIHINKREEDYIISFILEYVENHYAEDIYLNLFAEKLKLTAAYISSYFKEKMNVNLSDYINSYRIKKAITLIENPQNKNKDVASMVGLQNINTFIRLFKKYTGYTPGEYRKKHFSD